MPLVDLMFAVSARSTEAYDKMEKMKEIIKKMVDEYGSERIRYSLVVFGNQPSVELRFGKSFATEDQLKGYIDRANVILDGAALDKALEKAAELFEEDVRDDSKKVLVVIMDRESTSNEMDVEKTAESLWDKGVEVIPVAFGTESKEDELRKLTPYGDNLIPSNQTDKPKKVAETIMEKVRKGNAI